MKKTIIALALCISMALPLAACGNKESADESSTTAAAGESEVQSESGGETETETEEDPYIYAFEYDLTDYVKLCDYKGLEYTAADTSVTEEEVQSYIDYILDASASNEQIKDRAAADGDTVNINFKGTIDGKEFSGGSAEDYELTLGSGSFIDDFETQLIGHHPGEQVTVNVTFPDPYESNPDYAGKEASFAVTINGIYELPVFDDAFVKANLSENAQTVEEYKQYLKDTNYKTKLDSAVSKYVTDNISADKYPTAYLKHLKSLQMTLNENQFNYMQQMYAAYGMSFDYSSVMEYFGAKNTQEYEKVLQDEAEKNCLNSMAYQDLAAQAGIAIPRTADAQAAAGTHVPLSEARPGDILWRPGHVAIYAGGDEYIHEPHSGAVCERSSGIAYFTCAVRFR